VSRSSLPAGTKIIGSRYVYAVKTDSNGEISRFKARLVARGFQQEFGVDYEETFASTLRPESFRFLMSLVPQLKLSTRHLDVVSAFLHTRLEKEVYLAVPDGFILPSGFMGSTSDFAFKLNRAIYGLPDAGHLWEDTLVSFFEANGFSQSTAEPNIFIRNDEYVAKFVDDLFIFAADPDAIKGIVQLISDRFRIRDLGEISYALSININRDSDQSISLDQSAYISKLLADFGMSDCKSISSPIFDQSQSDLLSKEEAIVYMRLVGSLNYLAVWTRPDLAFACHLLSRRLSAPTRVDWKNALIVLRY
jgi:hypothetical protein